MKVAELPEIHRQAWDAAFAGGDLLGDAGPATRWSASFCRRMRSGFGIWLSWCKNHDIDPDVALPALVTPERVRAYLLDLACYQRA